MKYALYIALVSTIISCADPDTVPVNDIKQIKSVESTESDNTPSVDNSIRIIQDVSIVGSYVSSRVNMDGMNKSLTYKVNIEVAADKVTVSIVDGSINWTDYVNLDPNGWNLVIDSVSSYVENSKVKIFFSSGYKVNRILYKDRIFYIGDYLKYLDNHEVVVRTGDNLKYLIQMYNRENGTSYTIQDIVQKNPFLRSRKNYVIYEGDVINFK